MKAARSQKQPIDWSDHALKVDGRAYCKAEIRKFVRGINGKRQNPVTFKQICKWVYCTPETFISECLNDLITAGEIAVYPRSLASSRRFNGVNVYAINEH